MVNLKTLRDLVESPMQSSQQGADLGYELRKEAIKWVRAVSCGEKNTFDNGEPMTVNEAVAIRLILMEFFNLNVEDLE